MSVVMFVGETDEIQKTFLEGEVCCGRCRRHCVAFNGDGEDFGSLTLLARWTTEWIESKNCGLS